MGVCDICDISMLTHEDCINQVARLRMLFARMTVGGELSTEEIGERINIKYFEEFCFCKIESKTEKIKPLGDAERVIVLYTDRMIAINSLICDVYGFYPAIFEVNEEPRKIYKVEIAYSRLFAFLKDCISDEIDSLNEWKDALEVG